jgi:Zn-dependent protease
MAEPIDPPSSMQAADAPPGTLRCGFCGGAIDGPFFRAAGRFCCERCAWQIDALHQRNLFSPRHFTLGAVGGLAVAILCAAAWAAITVKAGSRLGFLAVGIGFAIGRTMQVLSSQRRGPHMQILAGVLTLTGILLGGVMLDAYLNYAAAIQAGESPAPGAIMQAALEKLRRQPHLFFAERDLLWTLLAVWIAWSMNRAFRIDLSGPFGAGASAVAQPPPPSAAPTPQDAASEPLSIAILKTVVSMAISIVIYWWFADGDWAFAVGLVGLILVHEMGHVLANVYYGIRAGPPIFIPFLGAVINLRQRPPNAKVEAIIGIGGPVLGTVGALICYGWALKTGSGLLLFLAHFGFFLNLFNLLPVPPLDGGRVTAAISPRVWIVGLVLMGLLVANQIRQGQDVTILLIIIVFALPRIIQTLRSDGHIGPYYDISRSASLSIATAYLLLMAVLGAAYYFTSRQVGGFI